MKKILFFIFMFILVLFVLVQACFALNINVCPSCNYTSIQQAINSASSGDTINVAAGTYNENQIIINKSLNVIGAGSDNTIINGADATLLDTGLVRIVSSGNVVFSGFKLINAGGQTNSGDGYDDKTNVGIYAESDSSSATYNISNNKIIGTNNPDDEQDYGFYSNSGKENLKFINNTITQTGANEILMELHSGSSDISYNTLDAGSYGVDPIFYMTYGGVNITSLQKISFNKIDLGTGSGFDGDHTTTGISFMSSFSGSGSLGDGKYSSIQILNNTLYNLNAYRRGISLYNDGNTTGTLGEISSAKISGNSITCSVSTNNFGIRLAGYVTNTIVSYNSVLGCEKNFYGTSARNSPAYPDTSSVKLNYNSFENGNFVWDGSTNLDAKFNWWGNCTPDIGKIIGNINYTPWLGACIKNKAQSKDCAFSTDSLTLYANVSSLSCIGNVIFSVNKNGILQNYTGIISNSGIGNYSAVISGFNGGQNVTWTVYAEDCFSHITQDGTKTFYVSKITNLSINTVSPDGLSGWYITEPLFTLTNTDATKIFYRWDSAGTHEYSLPFNLTGIPNPPSETAGILRLNYWSNTSCGEEQEQSKIFYVDLTNPIVESLVPADNAVINNGFTVISAVIDEVYGENSGLNKNSIVFKLDSVVRNITKQDLSDIKTRISYNANGLNNNSHLVELSGQDNAGRSFYKNWSFSVNSSAGFSLSINLPIAQLYSSKQIKFNISTTNIVSKIEYINNEDENARFRTLCSNCNSFTRTLSFDDGSNNLTIRASDKFGNSAQKNINFFIDSKIPRIITTEPARGKTVNGSRFYVKYTEDNLKGIVLYYGNSSKQLNCSSGNNKECQTSLNLSSLNGQYLDYWFVVSDYISNISSRVNRVLIDTSSPTLNVFSPQNLNNYSKNVLFNISISEKVNLEYIDNSVLSSRWTSLCNNCNKYQNIKRFSLGSHNLIIRAVDKAGNSNVYYSNFTI